MRRCGEEEEEEEKKKEVVMEEEGGGGGGEGGGGGGGGGCTPIGCDNRRVCTHPAVQLHSPALSVGHRALWVC